MKIKLSELRKLYREQLEDTQSPSRKTCPSPEKLLNFSRSKPFKKKRSKTTDHIARCNFCSQEFKLIHEILSQEKAFNQKIKEQLKLKGIKTREETKIREFVSLNRRKVLVFATSLFLAVIAVIFFLKYPIEQDYRGGQPDRINLVHPNEGTHSLIRLSFEWIEIPAADSYILEIFNQELDPTWKSEKLFQNKLIPPPELIELLEHNKTYFWMVTAVLESGNKVDSQLQSFTMGK